MVALGLIALIFQVLGASIVMVRLPVVAPYTSATHSAAALGAVCQPPQQVIVLN